MFMLFVLLCNSSLEYMYFFENDASLSHSRSFKMAPSIDRVRVPISFPLLTMTISCIFYPSNYARDDATISYAGIAKVIARMFFEIKGNIGRNTPIDNTPSST